MAFDKVIDSAKLDADLTTVADAIRARSGASGKLAFPNGMADAVRNIPSGVELPELTEPAEPEEVFSGKEYIDGEGQKKTGSFTIDSELTEQYSLISQIVNALKNKTAVSSGSLLVFTDISTGVQYTLYVDNGELMLEESSKIADLASIKSPNLYVDNGKLMMQEV